MKEALIDAAYKYIYQLEAYPIEAVRSQISLALEDILSLNQEEVLNQRLAYIGIGEAEDYLNQWLETREGYVLAGIRHLGGNPEAPFVDMWPSFRIKNVDHVIADLSPYFQKFSPKSYHFWVRPDINNYQAKILQQHFVGRVETMVKYDLELVKPKSYYPWYEDQYREFHIEQPQLKDRVPVNSKDLMDQCLEQNLLFVLKEGDSTIGLIAGEKEPFLGQSSVYIDEILVAKAYRGQGYAGQLLGSFVQQLDVTYVTCYIDHDNQPSTSTALRSGQKIFSQECAIEV